MTSRRMLDVPDAGRSSSQGKAERGRLKAAGRSGDPRSSVRQPMRGLLRGRPRPVEGLLDETAAANEAFIEKHGFTSRVHRRKPRGRYARGNPAARLKIRSCVEHVFAAKRIGWTCSSHDRDHNISGCLPRLRPRSASNTPADRKITSPINEILSKHRRNRPIGPASAEAVRLERESGIAISGLRREVL